MHDDVIQWKHFPRYWHFVWGIHRWPVNSPHKGQWYGALMFSLICAWINDWVGWRFETPSRPSWRHCSDHPLCSDLKALTTESTYLATNPEHILISSSCGDRWIPLKKASDAELWLFSLIWAWTNGWVNNRDNGDARRHRAHYDVTVMAIRYTHLCGCVDFIPVLSIPLLRGGGGGGVIYTYLG